MDQKELFIKFWEKEARAMREVIARIPEGSDYRPDPKSRTAKEIAWQIVREQISLVEGLEKARLEWTEVPVPATMNEVLEAYDALDKNVGARLRATKTSTWEGPLPFVFGEHEVARSPGTDTAWGFLFDVIHHRGQLSTYLRPMGAKVPKIYGPSADEPM
jgi:uncharacterized damage-inducible protein DinB